MSATLTAPRTQTPAKTRNPFTMLRREMDDLVSRFWDGEPEAWFTGTFAPSLDLTESNDAFEIRMDVPGLEAKEIDVKVQGNTVTISGQRKEEKEEKGKTYHRVERRTGSFSRTMTLPCDVTENTVAADYKQGVLTVKLPKCAEAKATKIDVKS
jgi:HSP20 family protein